MKLKPGQRWLYHDSKNDFVVEAIEGSDYYFSGKILQSNNKFFPIGDEYSINLRSKPITTTDEITYFGNGYFWQYLEGQENLNK